MTDIKRRSFLAGSIAAVVGASIPFALASGTSSIFSDGGITLDVTYARDKNSYLYCYSCRYGGEEMYFAEFVDARELKTSPGKTERRLRNTAKEAFARLIERQNV